MEVINNEYYVSLEVAKLLKEAGFDWKCYKVYKTDVTEDLTLFTYTKEEGYRNTSEFICSAPTLDVAQRWLREVKNYYVSVEVDCDSVGVFCTVRYVFHDGDNYNIYYIWEKDEHGEDKRHRLKIFNTYEEAQEAGINKVLDII